MGYATCFRVAVNMLYPMSPKLQGQPHQALAWSSMQPALQLGSLAESCSLTGWAALPGHATSEVLTGCRPLQIFSQSAKVAASCKFNTMARLAL